MTDILPPATIEGLAYDFVYSDVSVPNSSPYLDKVDLDIPTGFQVVGSGALVTQVLYGGVMTDVDSVDDSTVASSVNYLRISSGPHPTDSTKWRVMLAQDQAARLTVRAWIATIGATAS